MAKPSVPTVRQLRPPSPSAYEKPCLERIIRIDEELMLAGQVRGSFDLRNDSRNSLILDDLIHPPNKASAENTLHGARLTRLNLFPCMLNGQVGADSGSRG